MLKQGCVWALTGNSLDAIGIMNVGITAYRSTEATAHLPVCSSYFARAYADVGRFDDARRCIDEAMCAVETTKERLLRGRVHRVAGEIVLKSPEPDAAKAQAYFEHALAVARAQAGKVLGTTRRNEHGAALARSGQAG